MPEGRTDDAGQEDSAMMHPVVSKTGRQNWIRPIAKLLVDLAMLNLATVLAVFARLDFGAAPWSLVYILIFPGLVENLVFVAASVLLQTPLALWSYASLRDMERVAIVVAVTKVLTLQLLIAVSGEVQWSRGAFAASAVLVFLFMAGVRSIARWRYGRHTWQASLEEPAQHTSSGTRVLVVGAGDAGDMVLRQFEAHPELGKVVGLIDDDATKRGCTIRGVRVLGPEIGRAHV